MKGNSPPVHSNQSEIHPDLEAIVRKHLRTEFRRPYRASSNEPFAQIAHLVQKKNTRIIFDSGCGTGESTLAIADAYPGALVVGLDKSALRLGKSKHPAPANMMLIRADLVDIWRQAADAGWRLQHHFLLHPNPWPKKHHVKRRWYAHPVFPYLLRLGGTLHLRGNWRLYLQEFAAALKIATGENWPVQTVTECRFKTAFDGKYQSSGQELFELNADLGLLASDSTRA